MRLWARLSAEYCFLFQIRRLVTKLYGMTKSAILRVYGKIENPRLQHILSICRVKFTTKNDIFNKMCFYLKFQKLSNFIFFFLRIIFLVSSRPVIVNVDGFRHDLIDDVEHYVCWFKYVAPEYIKNSFRFCCSNNSENNNNNTSVSYL